MSQVEYATKEDMRRIMDKLELIERMLITLLPEIEIDEDEKKKIKIFLKKWRKVESTN